MPQWASSGVALHGGGRAPKRGCLSDSRAIGRLVPEDVIGLIRYLRER
jgi:hypothetical protein